MKASMTRSLVLMATVYALIWTALCLLGVELNVEGWKPAVGVALLSIAAVLAGSHLNVRREPK